jgi:hypothetical protein
MCRYVWQRWRSWFSAWWVLLLEHGFELVSSVLDQCWLTSEQWKNVACDASARQIQAFSSVWQ